MSEVSYGKAGNRVPGSISRGVIARSVVGVDHREIHESSKGSKPCNPNPGEAIPMPSQAHL